MNHNAPLAVSGRDQGAMREMPGGLTLGAQNTLQQHILNWGHYYQMKDFADSE